MKGGRKEALSGHGQREGVSKTVIAISSVSALDAAGLQREQMQHQDQALRHEGQSGSDGVEGDIGAEPARGEIAFVVEEAEVAVAGVALPEILDPNVLHGCRKEMIDRNLALCYLRAFFFLRI